MEGKRAGLGVPLLCLAFAAGIAAFTWMGYRAASLAPIPTSPTQSTRGAVPDIYFPELTKDLGDVAPGDEMAFSFQVGNLGRGDLEIASVRRSCQCAKLGVGARNVPPGQETRIEGSLSIPATGPTPGPRNGHIAVYSNDPDEPRVLLMITYRIATESTDDQGRLGSGTDEGTVSGDRSSDPLSAVSASSAEAFRTEGKGDR